MDSIFAYIYSITLAHFCCLSCTWYYVFHSLLTTIYDLWIAPIANPASSILYISSTQIFCLLIVFSNSSNHQYNFSFVTSLMRAASIEWERAVSNSGCRYINRYTQELPIKMWKIGSDKSLWVDRLDRISSTSFYTNTCFGRYLRIASRVMHAESAFFSGIVMICFASHDSTVDFSLSMRCSKVK